MTFKTLAALLVISVVIGWALWDAWSRGRIGGPFAYVERRNSPIIFWLAVVVFSFGLFLAVAAMVETAIKAISN